MQRQTALYRRKILHRHLHLCHFHSEGRRKKRKFPVSVLIQYRNSVLFCLAMAKLSVLAQKFLRSSASELHLCHFCTPWVRTHLTCKQSLCRYPMLLSANAARWKRAYPGWRIATSLPFFDNQRIERELGESGGLTRIIHANSSHPRLFASGSVLNSYRLYSMRFLSLCIGAKIFVVNGFLKYIAAIFPHDTARVSALALFLYPKRSNLYQLETKCNNACVILTHPLSFCIGAFFHFCIAAIFFHFCNSFLQWRFFSQLLHKRRSR